MSVFFRSEITNTYLNLHLSFLYTVLHLFNVHVKLYCTIFHECRKYALREGHQAITLSFGGGGHLSLTADWVLVLSSTAWTFFPSVFSFSVLPLHLSCWTSSELPTFLIKGTVLWMDLPLRVGVLILIDHSDFHKSFSAAASAVCPRLNLAPTPSGNSSISCTIYRSWMPLPSGLLRNP